MTRCVQLNNSNSYRIQVSSMRTNFYFVVSNIERMFKCIDGILSLRVSLLIYVLVVILNYNTYDTVVVFRYICNNSIIYSMCRSFNLVIFNVLYLIVN